MRIPLYSADLIKLLLSAYPPTTPKLTQTEREIFHRAGQEELVQNLKTSFDLQAKDEEDANVQHHQT